MGSGGNKKAGRKAESHADLLKRSGALRREGDGAFANGEEWPSQDEDDKLNNPPHFFVMCLALVAYLYYSARSIISPGTLLGALLATCLYVDPASAFLHVCLDNPNFNDLPLIGPHCRGFQRHHLDPQDIAHRETLSFAMEPSLPYMLVGAQGLLFSNPYYKLWFAVAYLPTLLMMFSHRWSHMTPKHRPMIAKFLQSTGLIMSDKHHRAHHATYDCNFAIFQGWSNDLFFNWAVKNLLHWEDWRWGPIAILYFISPGLVGCALYTAGVMQ
jgi:hypothetical protein